MHVKSRSTSKNLFRFLKQFIVKFFTENMSDLVRYVFKENVT